MVPRTLPELSQEAWVRILDSLGEGLAFCRDGRITFVNPALARLAGRRDASELHELSPDDLFEDAGAGLPHLATGAAVECRLRRLDAGCRAVLVEAVEVAASGEAVWVVRDLSELRRVKEELVRAHQALQEAGEERLILEERLQRELAARDDLVGVVSHELRTPVTVIFGYAKLLLTEKVGPLTHEQRRFLDEMRQSCRRLSDYVGTLLEAAAQAKGEVTLDLDDLLLAPVIQDVAGMMKPLLEQKRLGIEIELLPEAARARFDPSRVEQVLTNLLGNAIRYAPAESVIRMATRRLRAARECFVELSVSDQGPGVAPEDRERIFEPYVRSGDRRQAGGLGLGLAICRRLVEAHGGAIVVRSAPGGGACFAFTLPAAMPGEPS